MASYTSPSISGYNQNPPTNDGSEDDTNNLVDWDLHKDELADPIKTYAEAIDTNVTAAFVTVDDRQDDYGFEVTKNDAQTLTYNTWVALNWTAEVRDPGNDFALGDNTYVVPTDGVYQFNAQAVASLATGDGSSFEISIFKNPLGAGSFTLFKTGPILWNNHASDTQSLFASISWSGELTATDQIKIYGRYIDSDGSSDGTTLTTTTYQWWTGHRITDTT